MISSEGIFSVGLLTCTILHLYTQQNVNNEKPNKKYKKIDLHTHILPKTWPNLKEKFGYGGWIQLHQSETGGRARMMKDEEFFREVDPNCYDPEAILVDMENYGVDVQVICTVPVMFSYWAKPEHCADMSRFLNDDIAAVTKKYPKKICWPWNYSHEFC